MNLREILGEQYVSFIRKETLIKSKKAFIVELCADHIKPKDRGGDKSIDNGKPLSMEYNLLEKNYSQTEAGKRYFIKIYKQAISNNYEKLIKFCKDIFDSYDKHEINRHIPRPKGIE